MSFFKYIAYFAWLVYMSFAQNFKIHFSKFLCQILLSSAQNNGIIFKSKI